MLNKVIIYFFLLFALVSCTAKVKENKLDFNQLKSNILTEENFKNEFYEIEISKNKNEKDIWISSKNKNKEIYDTILKLYNLNYKTTFSDSTFNSWMINKQEIMLYQKSDSLILISILEK